MRLVALCMSLLIRRALSMARAAGPRQLRIEQALAATFSPTVLEVLNESHGRHEDESHFKVIVVSDQFEGVKPLIKRHRMVTAAITKDTGGPPRRPPPRSRARGRARRRRAALPRSPSPAGALDFHSLSVGAAKTPEEWAKADSIAASPKCAGGDGLPKRR